MKDCNAIEVHGVVKKFKVYQDKGKTIKELALFSKRRKYEERVVLDGISFEVKKGEAVGLIGHNGCGKSTTLKLLTKIMYPDSGSIEMRGRVSSLIELGAGFHPDMSGRQNIYTNASIFGLTRKEIEARFNDIVKFSELEEYIDNPVRTYSSGMYMRLAFSVAINVDADILLIDEILAVGDANFQAKCFNKLRELKAKGTTIIIVSHSLGQIEQICDKSIWINQGNIKLVGIPTEVHMKYLIYMGHLEQASSIEKNTSSLLPVQTEVSIKTKPVEIVKATLLHADGAIGSKFEVGENVKLVINYKINSIVENSVLGIKIYRNDNVGAYGTNTKNERIALNLSSCGSIECEFPNFNLVTGEYFIDIAFRSSDMLIYDYKTKIIHFETYYPIYEEGISHLDHKWNLVEED